MLKNNCTVALGLKHLREIKKRKLNIIISLEAKEITTKKQAAKKKKANKEKNYIKDTN